MAGIRGSDMTTKAIRSKGAPRALEQTCPSLLSTVRSLPNPDINAV